MMVGKSLNERPVAPGPPWNRVSPVKTAPSVGRVEADARRASGPGVCSTGDVGAARRRSRRRRPGRRRVAVGVDSAPRASGRPGAAAIGASVAVGDLDRRVDVVVVPVRAARWRRPRGSPTALDDRVGVVGGVDDEHLVVVADEPDVVVDVPGAAVEAERARGDDLLDPQPPSEARPRSAGPRRGASSRTPPRRRRAPIVSETKRVEVAAGPAGRGRSASGSRGWAGSRRTRRTSARRRGRRRRSAAARASCRGRHADQDDGAGQVAGVERLLVRLRAADRVDDDVGAEAAGELRIASTGSLLAGVDRVRGAEAPWPSRACGRRRRRR